MKANQMEPATQAATKKFRAEHASAIVSFYSNAANQIWLFVSHFQAAEELLRQKAAALEETKRDLMIFRRTLSSHIGSFSSLR